MKYFFYFCILLALPLFYFFTFGSYSNDTTIPTKSVVPNTTEKYTIVAFGDSLTAGYGVPLEDSYPSILEEVINKENIFKNKQLSARVINMGVSGETTSGGLERVDFVLSQNPDLILLGLGANDMLRATDPEVTKNNLETIIKKIREENVPLILLGMQSQASNGTAYKKKFDVIYPDLSKKYRLPLVPFFLQGVALRPSLNTSDAIHPNREGYIKIVDENILPILLPVLKSTGK